MSLFTIDISALLQSPVGSIEEFQFDQEIPSDTWEDLVCESDLEMNIKLIRQEYGLECIFGQLTTSISIPSEGIKNKEIEIDGVSREFHLKKRNEDTDDISYIDTHDGTIDLSLVLEQELLIAGF
jgi:hypothetical protein